MEDNENKVAVKEAARLFAKEKPVDKKAEYKNYESKEVARLFAKEKPVDKKAEYKNYESNDLMAEKPFGDEKQVVEKPKFESFEKPSNDAC